MNKKNPRAKGSGGEFIARCDSNRAHFPHDWRLAAMPLKLSDSELDAVMAAARPLDVSLRDAFLQQVASALQGCREIGPGVVYRVAAETQRRFFEPPDLSKARDQSKYR